jgi:CelD/BcsL family acetyltransferase involved in cellulose biosynthesis
LGDLALEYADSQEKVQDWMNELAILHTARWHSLNGPSAGFSSKLFRNFYLGLAQTLHQQGHLSLVRCRAGETVLGYLFNVCFASKILFLMSGINYSVGSNLKPGYLTHLLAIEHALSKNLDSYDFLIGEANYKRSLSNQESNFISLRLVNRGWRNWPRRLALHIARG